jgi:peroxiredoxin
LDVARRCVNLTKTGKRGPLSTRIFCTLAALAFCLAATPVFSASVTVGSPAPDFSAATLTGEPVALADYKGQVLVINFWATWCVPCKQELPLLESYYRARGRFGLRVVAVSAEGSVPPEKLKSLSDVLTLTMVRNYHGPYGPIARTVPTNFVIDRDGVVRYASAGAFTLDKLNEVLIPLLQQAPKSSGPTPIAASNAASQSGSPPAAGH